MDKTTGSVCWRLLAVLICLLVLGACEDDDESRVGMLSVGQTTHPIGTGTAVLTWTPPSTNTDGSPLSLMGFVVYHGASPNALSAVRMVGALDTTAVVEQLPAGTHYFAITAVSVSGAESAFSNIERKIIS